MIFVRNLLLCCVVALSFLSFYSCQDQNATANDLSVLNYALTLEHLEAEFYDHAQSIFNSSAFEAEGYNGGLYDYFAVIRAHERAHVDFLNQTITNLGGSPVNKCQYNFSAVTSVASYIQFAALLENTGVSAYTAGPNHLTNSALIQAAATILTVEARHAAFLNQLNNQPPFSSAFDTALSPQSVVTAASSFFIGCPGELELPSIRPNYATAASDLSQLPANITINNNQGNYTDEMKENDLLALNYALVLERLEAAFYAEFQEKFNESDFENAGFAAGNYSYFDIIRAHEDAHEGALVDIIQSRGGTPVPNCTYNFSSVQTVNDYIATAGVLENTGVKAYDGAVNAFSDIILQQIAATIASVEARHASYINELLEPSKPDAPFPVDRDEAVEPAGIISAAAPFFSTCPFNLTDPSILPKVAPAPVPTQRNDTNPSSSSTGTIGSSTGTIGSTTGTNGALSISSSNLLILVSVLALSSAILL